MVQFEPSRTFSSCKAGTLGDAMDGCLSGPRKLFVELQVSWRHASEQQLNRVVVGSDGGNMSLVTQVGDVLEQCDVRRAAIKLRACPCSAGNC